MISISFQLDKLLEKKNRKLLSVVDLDVKYSELEDRFLGCLAHEPSGRRYHEHFVPPKKPKKDNVSIIGFNPVLGLL